VDKGLFSMLIFLIGIVFGYLLFDWQNKSPTDRIVTKTEIKTDTVFVQIRDTIRIAKTEIKQEYLRDTVFIDGYKPKINEFKASSPFLHGNTYVSGEVLGEVLKIDIVNDFKIPTITNTITNTTTITKKPSGIFLMAGVNQQLSPSIGITLIKDRYLLGVTNNSIQLGYKLGK
jgi:hypothetical protein